MRVLGVDPGLTRCGLGVVDGTGGRTVRHVAVDVVRTPADTPVAERLLAVGVTVEPLRTWPAMPARFSERR